MAAHIKLLDAIALIEDIPALGLSAGEVGAVIEILDDGAAFEVVFNDNAGQTYGVRMLRSARLVPLHTRGQSLGTRVQVARAGHDCN